MLKSIYRVIIAMTIITVFIPGCNIFFSSKDSKLDENPNTDDLPEIEEVSANWADAGVQGGIPNYAIGIDVTLPPYNASGNGITDDSQAILDAIADCPEGQAVYLPAGSYRTTETIEIKKSIALRGDGPNATTVIHNHDGYGIYFLAGADRAGIEDLHVHTAWTGFNSYGGTKIQFENIENSWIRNIETSGYVGETIKLIAASHCEIRDSYIHNSEAETVSVSEFRSYGVEPFGEGANHNLIENNVFDWFRHAVCLNYESDYNVIAYNFSWNVWTVDGGTSNTTDMEFHHYNYDTDSQFVNYTLVEGNLFEQGTFASHEHNTALRNRINNGGFGVKRNNSFIGNEFVEKKHPGTWNENIITDIGENSVVHGNYILAESGIQWDPSIEDRSIPDSYYLSEKPEWFGDLDWPCYGGDLMERTNGNNTRRSPAEVRYWSIRFPEASPSDLSAQIVGGSVELSWTNNSSTDVDFIVCRSTDNVSFTRIGYTDKNITAYADTTANSGRTYYYYVKARNYLGGENGDNLGGESLPSNAVSLLL